MLDREADLAATRLVAFFATALRCPRETFGSTTRDDLIADDIRLVALVIGVILRPHCPPGRQGVSGLPQEMCLIDIGRGGGASLGSAT